MQEESEPHKSSIWLDVGIANTTSQAYDWILTIWDLAINAKATIKRPLAFASDALYQNELGKAKRVEEPCA